MASIQKRVLSSGKTSYRVQVRLKGYKTQRATFERITDAKKWAQVTEAALREGRHFKSSESKKRTVTEMLSRYADKLRKDNPKRLADVEHLLAWWGREIGHCILGDLNRALISEKLEKLSSKSNERDTRSASVNGARISPSTVNRYHAAFSHVCTIAVNEWEWLEENPLRKIKKLKEPRGRVRFLSDVERDRLLQACKAAPYKSLYVIVVLALSTGARKSEIMNMKWGDIDWDRRQIILHDTKNGERRLLPLTGHAYDLMREHARVRRIDTELVFPSQAGDKPYEIKRSWEGSLRVAHLEDFRFHDLRHSAASYLAMNGASLAEISEVLGHKTLQMVKRYAHLSEAHTLSVVRSMNERIFKNV
jgi:integrase